MSKHDAPACQGRSVSSQLSHCRLEGQTVKAVTLNAFCVQGNRQGKQAVLLRHGEMPGRVERTAVTGHRPAPNGGSRQRQRRGLMQWRPRRQCIELVEERLS